MDWCTVWKCDTLVKHGTAHQVSSYGRCLVSRTGWTGRCLDQCPTDQKDVLTSRPPPSRSHSDPLLLQTSEPRQKCDYIPCCCSYTASLCGSLKAGQKSSPLFPTQAQSSSSQASGRPILPHSYSYSCGQFLKGQVKTISAAVMDNFDFKKKKKTRWKSLLLHFLA